MKKLFFSKFPEYIGRNDSESEKALAIFKSGIESGLNQSKESGNALFLVSGNEPGTDPVSCILEYLNNARKKLAGNESLRGFKLTKSVSSMLKARLKDGFKIEDFYMVIDYKCREWKGTEFQRYIQPSTLFSASHFPEYLVSAESQKKVYKSSVDKKMNELME